MQRDVIVKSRSLGSSSDLTLLAPIQAGLVDALETVTFESRVKRVLEMLHDTRQSAHEFALARWISDAVERVEAIQSVRVAVLEPQKSVMLAVTFDGSWESYIRVLWARVGTLLDLIFCNTVDYITAGDHGFEEWLAWAKRVQVETGFFYGLPDFSARDALFQRRLERMRQRGAGNEQNELRATLPSPTEAVSRLWRPVADREDEPVIQTPPLGSLRHDQVRTGMMGVAALYRLTDLYPPARPDGVILRRAASDLLLEFVELRDQLALTDELNEARTTRFARQVDWLFPEGEASIRLKRPLPAPAERQSPLGTDDRSDIQGGILRPYDGVTDGVVLLLAFEGPAAAPALLDWLDDPERRLTRDEDSHSVQDAPGGAFRNLSLTLAGLRAAGLDEDLLGQFPEDFRQGMAMRCGHLGDVFNNHPRRWRLPKAFDAETLKEQPGAIDMDTVHAVLQWRCGAPAQAPEVPLDDEKHPLHAELSAFARELKPSGVCVLAMQPLRRRFRTEPDGTTLVIDHFGYADGSGQPEIETENAVRNRVHVGEIIVGHDNAADFGWRDESNARPQEGIRAWLFNGSFLAVRKYREFPHRLEQVAEKAAQEIDSGDPGRDRELAYAKLMGRWRDGHALVPSRKDINNFTYDDDTQGQLCPFHSHVRRANPRPEHIDPGTRLPRVMRRGMSYGPAYSPGQGDDGEDRGLIFMAYNASLGEQFEVVQRWLTGGNSTGNSSGTSCPIVGVPDHGTVRQARFEVPDATGASRVVRVPLEQPQASLLDEPPTLTRLEWGLYLFTPSFLALQRLRTVAGEAKDRAPAQPVPWELKRGRRILHELLQLQVSAPRQQAIEAWKAALQDTHSLDRLDAAALWAAIRNDHGGLLTTPYGHLVADRDWIQQVLDDPQQRYSVCGQLERMKRSFGPCYLGMDPGADYRSQSEKVNEAIQKLTASQTFDVTWKAATNKIDDIVTRAKDQAMRAGDSRYQVTFEAREVFDEALAALCEAWYGLQDDPGHRFARGPMDWLWQPGSAPFYPGHFHALSRHMFQPHPGTLVSDTSEQYGQALRAAMVEFVKDHLQSPFKVDAPLAVATMEALGANPDPELAARTMVGVLMGFIPTIAGAVANVLHEWQRDHRFDFLRGRLGSQPDYADASAVLCQALAEGAGMRPMPQVIWRTARQAHRLGDTQDALQIAAGDIVVLGLVSGTQQSLADGRPDGLLMFGGKRDGATHPQHACPGHKAAMGAMVGMLAALLARPEAMRSDLGPSTFVIEGELQTQPPTTPATQETAAPEATDMAAVGAAHALAGSRSLYAARGLHQFAVLRQGFLDLSDAASTTETGRSIAGWGDSWLAQAYPTLWGGSSIIEQLRGRYRILEDAAQPFCDINRWGKLQYMAANAEPFCLFLRNRLRTGTAPEVILLSGGGNDTTRDALRAVLRPKSSGQPLLDNDAANAHVARLRAYYVTILHALDATWTNEGEPARPVLLHGYDHPMPRRDFRRFLTFDWLVNPFKDKGYDVADSNDAKAADEAMRTLIDKLNDMLDDLATIHAFVHKVELRGTIATLSPNDPVQGWLDDLHPRSAAFQSMAAKFRSTIDQVLGVVPASPGAGSHL